MVIQTDVDSKRPNDQGRYLSKSAEQSSEPGCGLKIVTLLLLFIICSNYLQNPLLTVWLYTLLWRHNEPIANHQRLNYQINSLFKAQIKETSKFRVTELCCGNWPVTGEFPAQRDSDVEMIPFDDVIIHTPRASWVKTVIIGMKFYIYSITYIGVH